jgi:sporulation protein YlmC with PRC-barrel domain
MRAKECRLELLVGRKVIDSNGELVGHLEEVVAELEDDGYVVREFHVGAFAMFERLGAGMFGRGFLRAVGGARMYEGYVVPWRLMDLSRPGRPRVTVPKGELPRVGETRQPGRSSRTAAHPQPRRSA